MNTFFRLPVRSNSASFQLDVSKIKDFYPWDVSALGFWDFSQESPFSVDESQTLQAQSPSSPVAFDAGKLIYSTAMGNNVTTQFTELDIPKFTYTAVVYLPDPTDYDTSIVMLAGNYMRVLNEQGVPTPVGAQGFINNKKLAVTAYGPIALSTANVNEGWCFISASVDTENNLYSMYAFQTGSGAVVSTDNVGFTSNLISTANFGLGNDKSSALGFRQQIKASEFVLYDKYMSNSDLRLKYLESKGRQSRLGITI
ncbi:hypothetical protein [Klebsiella michiganensis]|uniref:hypothetical protein n=1 Tax=Klebsiella michiganensis TaxID=1134687 RepID=UPI002FF0DDA3